MEISEGLAVVRTGVNNPGNSPGTATAGFFNPVQKLNRDITVLCAYNIRPRLYLDGFTGTGLRAIRMEKEAGVHCVASERNRAAYEMSRENIDKNSSSVELHNRTFESVVSTYNFDFIDIDPYGSAFPYMDVALNYVRNGGYLGITATDLSTLSGSVPDKAKRRYGAYVKNDRMKHEMGIRLFLGYAAKRAAAFDRGIAPLISFWHGHYYRMIIRVHQNLSMAEKSLRKVKFFSKKTSISSIYERRREGPIWTGDIQDEHFIRGLIYPDTVVGVKEFVDSLAYENDSCGFFELTDHASFHSSDLPSLMNSMKILEGSGYRVHRTHFSHTGLKIKKNSGDLDKIWDLIAP